MQIITGILSFIVSLFTGVLQIVFRLIVALVAAGIAIFKGRNAFLWFAATFFLPWAILFLIFFPSKLGRVKSYLSRKEEFKDVNLVVGSLMALTAIVAKADGHVNKEEISLIHEFAKQNFRLSKEEINRYDAAFNYGKAHPEEANEFVRVLRSFRYRQDFILSISYLLIAIAVHDGSITEQEENVLQPIILGLGMSAYEYENLKRFIQGNMSGTGYGGVIETREERIEKYTKVLGVSSNADMQTIKKAYRQLAKECHPDKVMSEGMPEEYVTYANKRFSEITDAYEGLKELLA